jgi:hypothetical protein
MSAADRWRRLPPPARVVAAVVGALVAVELALGALETATGGTGPGGPDSSSYATQPAGLAAYAELLAASGHPVRRLRSEVTELESTATLLVADAPVPDEEYAAIGRFVEGGGRIVLAGGATVPLAHALVDGEIDWRPSAPTTARPVPPPAAGFDVTAVGSVRTAGEGAFAGTGAARSVLAADGDVVAAVGELGTGTVVLLADSSPLQNRFLGLAGNAAFGLAAAGPASRSVVFSESGHGYGKRTGLDAVPSNWLWALTGGALATLVWVWSRGRRLGPPDDEDVEPPPRRRAYVDAVAATLLRTNDPAGAIGAVQTTGRERLARRTGVAPDDDAALRAAAIKAGVSEHDVDAIISPVRSHDDAVRAARALTRLAGKT